MSLDTFDASFQKESGGFIEDWKALLRIPSISGDPKFSDSCLTAAHWLVDKLEEMGLSECHLIETSGKPIVHAKFIKSPSARNVLFYGHYDVQPAPLDWVPGKEKWQSDPFEPIERDGRIVARGAQDNKGQLMYFLSALKTSIREGTINCNVELYIEGEEESHSVGIEAALPTIKPRGDVLIVCDTETTEPGTAGITLGLRGLVALEVYLGGISGELHSGKFGGAAPNPITELSRMIATLHNSDGSIAVPNYYEGVPEFTEVERAALAISALDEQAFIKRTGVPPRGGERSYPPEARVALRPTIEPNGIQGGWNGEGPKTIIPMEASVKITSRLVGTQDPEACLERLVQHLKSVAPEGLTLTIKDPSVGGPALLLDAKSELVLLAQEVLQASTGKPARLLWSGGSIPVVAKFARIAGAQPLLVGHGLSEDLIHEANESFALEQFRLGYLNMCRLLQRL
jgi:acetylornithine deacetylase/succinyl-diaminopimelate desuccinylase-like protein